MVSLYFSCAASFNLLARFNICNDFFALAFAVPDFKVMENKHPTPILGRSIRNFERATARNISNEQRRSTSSSSKWLSGLRDSNRLPASKVGFSFVLDLLPFLPMVLIGTHPISGLYATIVLGMRKLDKPNSLLIDQTMDLNCLQYQKQPNKVHIMDLG
jgi:hypothetical protein